MTSPAAPGDPSGIRSVAAASADASGARPTPGTAAAASGIGPMAASAPAYAVKLPVFEGPLDLLPHLIRQNEVEITDIPIAQVGAQYLEYLELMRELDLDVAGEYLLMAATLAWIKSRMLLPPDGQGEDGEEVDPRAELVARLLEYQRFKQAAHELSERNLLGRDVFEVRGPGPEPLPEGERELEVGLFELLEAFRRALKRAGPSGAAHEIEVEHITVRERMLFVMQQLEQRDALQFEEILLEESGGRPSRTLLVATFLAILELTRLEALRLYQGADERGVPRGPIHLRRADTGDWAARIAEVM
jgi:segregation and condensation protein A